MAFAQFPGLVFTSLTLLSTPLCAQERLAFVVGINAYPNLGPEAQLRRAVNDANAIGDTFEALGFKVTRLTKGASLDTFLKQFDSFISTISKGDTVVIFYAGHGVSLEDGTYLLPADIPALGPNDALRAHRLAIAEKDLTQQIRLAGAKIAMAVIDACRDNPFPRQGTRSIGISERGLGRLAPERGVFTLYSASEGQTALDRLSDADTNPNSVFTRILITELKKPNINLVDLFLNVQDEVADLARSVHHDQVPSFYTEVEHARDVRLAKLDTTKSQSAGGTSTAVVSGTAGETNQSAVVPGTTVIPGPIQQKPAPPTAYIPPGEPVEPAPPVVSADEEAWQTVSKSKDREKLKAFLRDFPASSHAADAKTLLASLSPELPSDKPLVKPHAAKPPPKRAERAANSPSRATSGSGKCFNFNGQHFCE